MRNITIISLVTICLPGWLFAQDLAEKTDLGAYLIPFDTEGNRIELAVANGTGEAHEDLEVRAVNPAAWITMEPESDEAEGGPNREAD